MFIQLPNKQILDRLPYPLDDQHMIMGLERGPDGGVICHVRRVIDGHVYKMAAEELELWEWFQNQTT